MVLHCLAVGHRHPSFIDCLSVADREDTILLLGDGVYNALPGSQACTALQQHDAKVVLLEPDAKALGVAIEQTAFTAVAMDGFVQLTEACPRQLAWY